jgi:hypothetical protein
MIFAIRDDFALIRDVPGHIWETILAASMTIQGRFRDINLPHPDNPAPRTRGAGDGMAFAGNSGPFA